MGVGFGRDGRGSYAPSVDVPLHVPTGDDDSRVARYGVMRVGHWVVKREGGGDVDQQRIVWVSKGGRFLVGYGLGDSANRPYEP